ncbi:MAG: hypothetical protein JKX76_02115 [Colwellia sp.]|nr:hypothetical protein [Colwellia sp.]
MNVLRVYSCIKIHIENTIDYATRTGILSIVQEAMLHDPPLYPSQKSINTAAENGHIYILQTVYMNNQNLFPSQLSLEEAVYSGHYDVMKFGLLHGESPIFDDFLSYSFNSIVSKCDLPILKWLASRKVPRIASVQNIINLEEDLNTSHDPKDSPINIKRQCVLDWYNQIVIEITVDQQNPGGVARLITNAEILRCFMID